MLTVAILCEAACDGERLGGSGVAGGGCAEAQKPPLFLEISVDTSVSFVPQEVCEER